MGRAGGHRTASSPDRRCLRACSDDPRWRRCRHRNRAQRRRLTGWPRRGGCPGGWAALDAPFVRCCLPASGSTGQLRSNAVARCWLRVRDAETDLALSILRRCLGNDALVALLGGIVAGVLNVVPILGQIAGVFVGFYAAVAAYSVIVGRGRIFQSSTTPVPTRCCRPVSILTGNRLFEAITRVAVRVSVSSQSVRSTLTVLRSLDRQRSPPQLCLIKHPVALSGQCRRPISGCFWSGCRLRSVTVCPCSALDFPGHRLHERRDCVAHQHHWPTRGYRVI